MQRSTPSDSPAARRASTPPWRSRPPSAVGVDASRPWHAARIHDRRPGIWNPRNRATAPLRRLLRDARPEQTRQEANQNDCPRSHSGSGALDVPRADSSELIRPDIEVDFVATRNGAHILDSFYEATLADVFCLDIGARAET